MTTKSFAARLGEAMLGGGEPMRTLFPKLLEEAKVAFDEGDRSQLWDVICYCALFQATVPDWAVDALLDAREALKNGRMTDLNEVFGKVVQGTQVERARAAHFESIRAEVLVQMHAHRVEGAPLNRATFFDDVADQLKEKGSRVRSKKDVEKVYDKMGGQELVKSAIQGTKSNVGVLDMSISMRQFKCTGRPVLDANWPRFEPAVD